MQVPTEPIRSIPRPPARIAAFARSGGEVPEELREAAVRDTRARFGAPGAPVTTGGEQREDSRTYCEQGLPSAAPGGFPIRSAAGHVRRTPRLTGGPFRYKVRADAFVEQAVRIARVPPEQAVISPSAPSLMYPAEPLAGDSRDELIRDLLQAHVDEVRGCPAKGAGKVQLDVTEARLARVLGTRLDGEVLSEG